MVVRPTPVLQYHAGLGQRPQLLTVQALLTQPGVEALDIAVLPRAAGVDVDRLNLVLRQPCTQVVLDEFAAVVASDVLASDLQSLSLGHRRWDYSLSGIEK